METTMTRTCRCIAKLLLSLALLSSSARAVTFNTDTFIGVTDSAFDLQDIEVTNCVLTIDGPHSFSSLHIENGGIVTHSFSNNALLLNMLHVSNEVLVVTDTNPPILSHSNLVDGTLVLSDTNFVT